MSFEHHMNTHTQNQYTKNESTKVSVEDPDNPMCIEADSPELCVSVSHILISWDNSSSENIYSKVGSSLVLEWMHISGGVVA